MSELLLVVSIGGRRVAIRAAEIQSVVDCETLAPIPRAPDYVAGLGALRSRALTVIDCNRSLQVESAAASLPISDRKIAVVEHEGHLYGLLVDAVDDVAQADAEPQPVWSKLEAGWQRVALGIVETSSGPLLLIDTAGLIAGPAAEKAA